MLYSAETLNRLGDSMNIIVSGMPGTGTTTLCQKLAEEFGFKHIYAGSILRNMALDMQLTIEEFYTWLSSDPERESDVDARIENMLCTEDKLIVEGRMAPFMRCTFPHHRILLTATEDERVRRLKSRKEYVATSPSALLDIMRARIETERKRYLNLYGIKDHFDERVFNILVETTCFAGYEVVELVKQKLLLTDSLPPSSSSLLRKI